MEHLYIKIESAQEKILSVDPQGDAVLTMEDVARHAMREPAKTMLTRISNGSCPAFEYWVDRLKVGERLPRGKYFKTCEFFRSFKAVAELDDFTENLDNQHRRFLASFPQFVQSQFVQYVEVRQSYDDFK
ncbi:hypothetical protein F164LOC_20805 [Pectobacterium carotovorum]|nr:hypothetical protein F164LOC_20805 [Pectobacterium carotovorum]